MRLGTALVISAPSGAGKTTLVRRLLAAHPSLAYSVSCTTRAPRRGEVEGRDYHFLKEEDFLRLRASGAFAEWAQVHGNRYGTLLAPLEQSFREGRDLLLDVDVQGAAQLRLSLPRALFVFVLPPSLAELERRLRARGTDSDEVVARRLANAGRELAEARWFDAVVVNGELDRASVELEALYRAATLRTALHRERLDDLAAEWAAREER